jgi:hypothetical protein
MNRLSIAALAAGTLLAGGIAVAGPAEARTLAGAKAPTVTRSGHCSSAAVTWKLKTKADNGRLQVEFEVDSNRNGQVWTWSIRDNGVLTAKGSARTVAPSGSFSVERRIPNRTGADRIVAVAKRGTVTCTGALTY